MGLDENLFGFIFNTAVNRKKKLKSEDEFKRKIRGMSSSFEDSVAEMITDLVIENIDYLVDVILEHKPHELAANNVSVLKMMLQGKKARAVLEGAKKQRRYIRWDTKAILEAVLIVLKDKGITFNEKEALWLAYNIQDIGKFIYQC